MQKAVFISCNADLERLNILLEKGYKTVDISVPTSEGTYLNKGTFLVIIQKDEVIETHPPL